MEHPKPLETREAIVEYIVSRLHQLWDIKNENDIPEDTTLDYWRGAAHELENTLYMIDAEKCVEWVKRRDK